MDLSRLLPLLFGRGWYRDFLDDLRRLLASGIAVIEALAMLTETSRGASAALAAELGERVRSGRTLGEACAGSAQVPAEHAALVEAGERSGTLVAVLASLVGRIDRQQLLLAELRAKVSYPALVVCCAVTLLPLPMIFLGNALGYLFIQVLFWSGVVVVGVLIGKGPGVLEGRPALHTFLERAALRMPFLGSVLVESAVGKTFGLLGLLIGAGLPISASIQLAARTARLLALRTSLATVEPRLIAGSTLTQAFASATFFAPRRQWLGRIAAAEKAGALDEVFSQLGEELERAVQARLAMILRIVPVVLLLGVGVLVLVQALRVIVPLYGGS